MRRRFSMKRTKQRPPPSIGIPLITTFRCTKRFINVIFPLYRHQTEADVEKIHCIREMSYRMFEITKKRKK